MEKSEKQILEEIAENTANTHSLLVNVVLVVIALSIIGGIAAFIISR